MSLINLHTPRLSTPTRRSRRHMGTPHRGPTWKSAVGLLRIAVRNTVEHVDWRPGLTADDVGLRILDHIAKLDARSLRVLAIVFGILVRASDRNGGSHEARQ
jgi:hypothetical protein